MSDDGDPYLLPDNDHPDIFNADLDALRLDVKEKRNSGGCSCPVCGQYCKTYKRKLNSAQAAFICWLVREWRKVPDEWINVPIRYPHKIGGEYGKLAHFGLAVLQPNPDDSSKKTSGMWKPTWHGVQFVRGSITVPKYIFLYDNNLEGVSSDQITIREALGEKFDYAELMRG